MSASAGWYPDPVDPRLLRWWDGGAWSGERLTPTAPAGWYRGSGDGEQLRWWNGAMWTDHTLGASPKVKEPQPTFAASAAFPTLIGITLSVVCSRVFAQLLFNHLLHSDTVAIAALYVPLYSGLTTTCVWASRRYGSGRVSADFGWRFRPGDLWSGPLAWLLAGVSSGAVIAVMGQEQVQSRTHDTIRYGASRMSAAAIVGFALAAVVAAPLLEELVFRGLLQRSLTTRLGVWSAVVIQAVVFGAYHFDPDFGVANVAYVVGLSIVGLILGFAAMRWRRLGPGIVAHFIFNIFFVLAVITTR